MLSSLNVNSNYWDKKKEAIQIIFEIASFQLFRLDLNQRPSD